MGAAHVQHESDQPTPSVTSDAPFGSLLTPFLRVRYLILVVAAAMFALQHISGTGKDWRYLVEGGELLFGQHHRYTSLAGGLHLFANYPTIQIGPLSLLLAAPLRLIGSDDGRLAGAILMTAVAPALVFVLERTARVARPGIDERFLQLTVLLG